MKGKIMLRPNALAHFAIMVIIFAIVGLIGLIPIQGGPMMGYIGPWIFGVAAIWAYQRLISSSLLKKEIKWSIAVGIFLTGLGFAFAIIPFIYN